ncbi:FkbM family methyltransferase [Thalassobaculum sp.]|uniref:FkbM family methyltransferase n=1 Tax=Thalassobaculum sp. TaxID=2022740 RepID=UPI0032EC11E1
MPSPGSPNPIEEARRLIAGGRTADARRVLSSMRGVQATAGPVELLVAYSYLGEADIARALDTLRRIPDAVAPVLGLAVARLLMTCDAGDDAAERLRRVLVLQPSSADAATALAEACILAGTPEAGLAWALRAATLGAASPGLAAARLQGLIATDQDRAATRMIEQAHRAGQDVDAMVATAAGRLLNADGPPAVVDRTLGALGNDLLRRPRIAATAAGAAYACGSADRAAALLDAAGWVGPAAVDLRHQIALDRAEPDVAATAVDRARGRVLLSPQAPDPAVDYLQFQLRSRRHDSVEIHRWTGRAACLAGPGLRPGPDRLFDECVRWKNDMSQRLNGRGAKIAHALGTLAAEASFGGTVAVRNGATEAHIDIAGHSLALRLTSGQVRRTTSTLFAMEPGMLRWFAGFSPDDVLVDVGANVGVYTVLAAAISGCRVVAIEPFSPNVADLEHNVALNGLENRVTVMHAAASDRERIDTLYFGQRYAGAANQSFGRDDISEQYRDREAGRETVRGVPIDVLVARGEIPFPSHVKIDVDGFEEQVIEGMRGILADPRFKSLRMEIRWHEAERRKLVDSIADQGYSVAIADDAKNLLFTRLPAA